MSALINLAQKVFRKDESTEEISLGDLDIVNLSVVSWAQRKELNMSKKNICFTFLLSLLVVGI